MENRILTLSALLGLVVISSGCIDAEAHMNMESVGGTDLGEEASVNIEDMHPDFEDVIKNGSSLTVEEASSDVLENGFPVLYNGSLYSLNRSTVGERNLTRVEYSVERVEGSSETQINLTRSEKGIIESVFDTAEAGSNISKINYNIVYSSDEENRSILIDRNETRLSRGNTTVSVTKI